jgi:hypothetical protein
MAGTIRIGENEYTILGELGGSTRPLHLEDKDGKQFVLKWAKEPRRIAHVANEYLAFQMRVAHVANEYLAFQLYKAAGCRVPNVEFVRLDELGGYGLLEDYIPNETLRTLLERGDDDEQVREQVRTLSFPALQPDLILHALFGNWDINNTENIIIPRNKDGGFDYANPVIIDLGGTLQFRAMGELKNADQFTGEVTNHNSIVSSARSKRSRYNRPFKMAGVNANSIICNRWNDVNASAILRAFDKAVPIVRPHFKRVKKVELDIVKLRAILVARIAFFYKFCGEVTRTVPGSMRRTVKRSPKPAGGAGTGPSGSHGGGRRAKWSTMKKRT